MAETKISKSQASGGVWTEDNLLAGTNISITQVPQPVIDANTLGVWHLDGNADNAVVGSSVTLKNPYAFSDDYKKFGSQSARLVGTSSGAENIITALGPLIGTEDFTLDFWYMRDSVGNNSYDSSFALYIAGFRIYPFSGGYYIQDYNSYTTLQSSSLGVWHHLAVVRHNGILYYFVDGVKQSVTTNYTDTPSALGANSSYKLTSEHIDELRLSNIARWTSDFTPYTEPYSASAGDPKYQINNTATLTSYTGYDATKTQVLKNVNGTLTWVDEA